MGNLSKSAHDMKSSPIPFDPTFEVLEIDESKTGESLIQTLLKISATTFKHSGHATRSVHAKSHGLLSAELEVFDNLPEELKQGIFANPITLPVVMRFSTIPGDILDDKVSTPRGLAIKIIGVQGKRLPSNEQAITQDFVLVNGPNFLSPSAKQFLFGLKFLSTTTDIAPNFKKIISKVLQKTAKLIESLGGNSDALKSLGGHPETNILGETYYSQAPILYGKYMAKIAIMPACNQLQALKDLPVDLNCTSDGLKKAVVDFFTKNTAEWNLCVQLCTDIEKMPIEDSSIVWPENLSPYIPVARLRAKPQIAWSPHRSIIIDDGMRFSPWNGIEAHRPLGSLMRLRKKAYEMSSNFRNDNNQEKIKEPIDLIDLG